MGSARTQGKRENNTRAGAWGKKGAVAGKGNLVSPQPPRVFSSSFSLRPFPHYLGAWNRLYKAGTGVGESLVGGVRL